MMMINPHAVAHIVWGRAQKGKTSTIIGIAHHMMSTGGTILYPKPSTTTGAFTIPSAGDFKCIIEHTNKKGDKLVYTIMSAGDTDDGLQDQWDDLNKYTGNVDIIIGACRTKLSTPAWWNMHSFDKKWFDSNDEHTIHYPLYTTTKIEILKLILDI